MSVRGGIIVVGAVGGCGTTTLAAALALAQADGGIRVLGLDGHGGGPGVLWGMSPDRTVDDLDAVRSEVDGGHAEQIIHRQAGGIEVVIGPRPGRSSPWSGGDADRLAAALVPDGPWVADCGRGGHDLARAMARHASLVVVMSPRTVAGATACGEVVTMCDAPRVLVAITGIPGEPDLSGRAFRRLMSTRMCVDVPTDPRGAQRVAAAVMPTGRRGIALAVRSITDARDD